MTPDDLARFLERLSPDAEEAGCRYIHLREKKLVGFFYMKGVSDPADAAAETVERAAVRISRGADVPDVEKYCLGIARNVARERWRREQREDTGSRRFIESLASGSAEEVERIEQILKPCFEQLEDEEQELMVAYCRIPEGLFRAEYRRHLAEKRGLTVRALRIRVSRLRDRLADCVEQFSKTG